MSSSNANPMQPAHQDMLHNKYGLLDIVKYRWLYMSVSLIVLIPGIFYIVSNMMNPDIKAPVRLGIDFIGGTMLEYGFEKPVTSANIPQIQAVFDKYGYTGSVVQTQEPTEGINKASDASTSTTTPAATTPAAAVPAAIANAPTAAPVANTPASDTTISQTKTPMNGIATPNGISTIVSIRSKQLKGNDDQKIVGDLEQQFGKLTLLQKNSVGPSLASELLQKGFLALILAYILIVGYLTFRFEFDFAVCAIIALVHDAFFVLGCFAMMGAFYHTEVDSMFVTAILTVVGFSVHDTIVVFDRVRENYRLYYTKKVPFNDIVNMSVNQTLARSCNTSLSALLPLLALYFFGGETTKDFVLAAILGITVGTYSSIFIASAMLSWWREKRSGPQTAAA